MGCDIHIVIQRQENGAWVDVPWVNGWHLRNGLAKKVDGLPIAPDDFDARNYNLFGILAGVRRDD